MSARKSISLMACFVCLAMAATVWSAAAPSKLSYQAVLLTSGGQPVTTPVSVVFTIYDAASGGNVMWTETRNVTPDALGRVNVMLGDNTPVAEPVFAGPNRWLGIQVGADPEMTPRAQFAASAYSNRVSTVDGSTGGTMDGNLTLRSTAAAEKDGNVDQPAQLTLISLNGDTIVVGPADQLVFRAVDASGTNLMSAAISGPNGPVFGIADPGGNIAEHSGTSSSYYGNSTKNGNALQKQVEVGADGVIVFGATENDTVAVVDVAGVLQSKGLNVETDAPVGAEKDAQVCGSNNGCGMNGNSCIGFQHNLTGAQYSMAIGNCNQIASGIGNFAVGGYNTLSGGAAYSATIGTNNFVNDAQSLALGGYNFVAGLRSFAVGSSNFVEGISSGAMGQSNYVNRTESFAFGINDSIGGTTGQNNFVTGRANRAYNAFQCTVFGDSNEVSGLQNVCFGKKNSIGDHPNSASNCSILGGQGDTIEYGANASIIAGDFQYMTGSTFSIIGAGRNNTIDNSLVTPANVDAAGIFSGSDNYVGNTWAFIGGGYSNSATGLYSLCAGGNLNASDGNQSTVSGGGSNTASGSSAVVCGGEYGLASGQNSVVGGGYSNQATGAKSTAPGGHGCMAAGDYSFATGTEAKANNVGEFVWADNSPYQFPVVTESNFSPSSNDFLARATGGFVLVTGVDGSGNSTSGVQLASGGGSWASLSDVNSKENVRFVNTEEVLEKIAQLDIASWNYKSQDDAIRHIGPMAQDLYALFGYGEDEKHITSVDADGIALAAIQALHKRTQELESQKTEINALRDQIAELKQLVESMSHQR